MSEHIEGLARFRIPEDHRLFYNPRGKLARDLGVLALRVLHHREKRALVLADAFSGIGARVIRYALEVPGAVEHFWINDGSPISVVETLRQMHGNGITVPFTLRVREAIRFFRELSETGTYPYWIDLDTFGSPSPFLDHALLAVQLGGVLYFTATDTPPLCGIKIQAAFRNYGAHTARSIACHELGIRVVVGEAIRAGGRRGHRVIPLFSVFDGYAFRILIRVERGRGDFPHRAFGMVRECAICHAMFAFRLNETPASTCPYCGSEVFRQVGPLWMGPLHDPDFVRAMLRHMDPWYDREKARKKLRRFLGTLSRELPWPPFFYPLATLSKFLGVSIPSTPAVVQALREAGYEASETHFTGQGVRTSAPYPVLLETVRRVALRG